MSPKSKWDVIVIGAGAAGLMCALVAGKRGRRVLLLEKNSKVVIIEDVITTGKSSLECSKLVEKAGGKIEGYGCIIDRSNKKSAIDQKIISQIELNIPTYTNENLPESLSLIKAVKPGSRNL